MSEIILPKVECVESEGKFGRFIAEPLAKGFGTTLGNALRRVLLSYLPGAAVTRVTIEGIQHEFSSIPFVREDTTEFLLNIKALRLKSLTGQPGTLRLDVSGQKTVYASDIVHSADFEIINPEIYICTLDSLESKLYVEFDIDLGRGYRAAESSDDLPLGTIPLDSVFTPLRKVNFSTEPVHMGQETNRERLILEIWTDGSISPADALSQAAEIMIKEIQPFTTYAEAPSLDVETEETATGIPDKKYNIPVEQLDLSVRTMNCLRHAGITNVGELVGKEEKELMGLRNFGQKSAQELRERLDMIGVSLASDERSADTEKRETEKTAAEAE